VRHIGPTRRHFGLPSPFLILLSRLGGCQIIPLELLTYLMSMECIIDPSTFKSIQSLLANPTEESLPNVVSDNVTACIDGRGVPTREVKFNHIFVLADPRDIIQTALLSNLLCLLCSSSPVSALFFNFFVVLFNMQLLALLAAAATLAAPAAAAKRFAMYFDQWHTTQPSRANTVGITHVITAFAASSLFNSNPPGWYGPFMEPSQLRPLFDPGTKICMAIGGWGDTAGYSVGQRTDDSRKTFAKAVAAMLDQHGYDCVGELQPTTSLSVCIY